MEPAAKRQRVADEGSGGARRYPFALDPYQLDAMAALDRGESCVVSAPTAAGKTVIAEHAFARAFAAGSRAVYASPLKALSNDKFRQFVDEWGGPSVGMLTGDVSVNHDAPLLVLTTEVLRSMLYRERGDSGIANVSCVVFDEIHYMSDPTRGVVWEEVIVMLPHSTQLVFLSATIPNAAELAEWVEQIHPGMKCAVVHTEKRPVPLVHYITARGSDCLRVMADNRGFIPSSVRATENGLRLAGDETTASRRGGTKPRAAIFAVVRTIMERGMYPVIVFCFSKRETEAMAVHVSSMECNRHEERELVDSMFGSAMATLSEEDRRLPCLVEILPLLRRGIGIHHSGLLPVVKEMVEILFADGLIKILFSTETFSLGLNLPARTVILSSCRKFDGKQFRLFTAGEYLQITGRAGRRGKDKKGYSVLMLEEPLGEGVLRQMTCGSPDPLRSAFHLTFNMVLSQLRGNGSPEFLIRRSFFQFQTERQRPFLEQRLAELRETRRELVVPKEEAFRRHGRLVEQLKEARERARAVWIQPKYVLRYMQLGRVVRLRDRNEDWGWGAVITFHQAVGVRGKDADCNPASRCVDVLVRCKHTATGAAVPSEEGEPLIVPLLLSCVQDVHNHRVRMPTDLRRADARRKVWDNVAATLAQIGEGDLLDPLTNPDLDKKDRRVLRDLLRRCEALEDEIAVKSKPVEGENSSLYAQARRLDEEIALVEKSVELADKTLLGKELRGMKAVLRRLGHLDSRRECLNTPKEVLLKGLAACEVFEHDELLVTEAVVDGVFKDSSPEAAAAILSCFVCPDPTPPGFVAPVELSESLELLYASARRIARAQNRFLRGERKDDVDAAVQEAVRPVMTGAVLAWCRGVPFSQVCGTAGMFEGVVSHTFHRLDTILRQVIGVARVLGNDALKETLDVASEMVSRGLPFGNSLYL